MLWLTPAARLRRVVRWVTKGDRVLLLNIDYTVVADSSTRSPVASS